MRLRHEYGIILTWVSTIASLVFIFIEIPSKIKLVIGLFLLILVIGLWAVVYFRANTISSVSLDIQNSTVNVRVGDIFGAKELKAIAFNEYFDTIVDNKIISKKSLNGQYLDKHVSDVSELDGRISTDPHLLEKTNGSNENRKSGKRQKYVLGSIYRNEEYLLTAFSRFDDDNRAYLEMSDYINFLLNFWDEIDIIYAGKSVTIPLFGSGITRFKEYTNISDQELLEILLWSFKVKKIKFKYPSCVTILIHDSIKDKINFYSLKRLEV